MCLAGEPAACPQKHQQRGVSHITGGESYDTSITDCIIKNTIIIIIIKTIKDAFPDALTDKSFTIGLSRSFPCINVSIFI